MYPRALLKQSIVKPSSPPIFFDILIKAQVNKDWFFGTDGTDIKTGQYDFQSKSSVNGSGYDA